MRAIVSHIINPFHYTDGVVIKSIGEALAIRDLVPVFVGAKEFKTPTICLLNSKPLLRASWDYKLVEADNVVFLTLPAGGGDDPNKVSRTVLTIALIAAAAYTGGIAGAATNSFIGSLTTGVIIAAGSVLINRALPPPRQPNGDQEVLLAASPTYSLQAQGNRARLEQPIPSIYGRLRVFPDFASAPYTVYENNNQFLYHLLVIGQGEYVIDEDEIFIEDSKFSDFPEAEYALIGPGQPNQSIELVDPYVVTAIEVSGQELKSSLGSSPGEWIGPFTLSPAETFASKISVDVAAPSGIYTASGNSLVQSEIRFDGQVRVIDDQGTSVGGWHSVINDSINGRSFTPNRQTFTVFVPFGRLQMRMRRITKANSSSGDSETNRSGDTLVWESARAHLTTYIDNRDITMLAVKFRATDSLSAQSSRKINLVVERKLPIYEKLTNRWLAPTRTRGIAWAFADIARNQTYGGALADNLLDTDALLELDQKWKSLGDTFNATFDKKQSLWECLTLVARAGRALPLIRNGVLTLVRDQPTLVSAMFTMRNISKDSLVVDYIAPTKEVTDNIVMSYFDEVSWKTRHVNVEFEASSSKLPVRVPIFGCTNRAQALREGTYLYLTNKYRKKHITFQTELEGFIPTYGSAISISHDMPGWGMSGDIVDFTTGLLPNGTAYVSTLTTDQPVGVTYDETNENTYIIILRDKHGNSTQPARVFARDGSPNILLPSGLVEIPEALGNREPVHFAFGKQDEYSIEAKVVSPAS